MKNLVEKTEYILLPLSIYLKFFKDVKVSGKKISAVLDEAEIKKNKRKSKPTEIPQPREKKPKHKEICEKDIGYKSDGSDEYSDTESSESSQ